MILQKKIKNTSNIGFSYFERKTLYKIVPHANNFFFDLGVEMNRVFILELDEHTLYAHIIFNQCKFSYLLCFTNGDSAYILFSFYFR